MFSSLMLASWVIRTAHSTSLSHVRAHIHTHTHTYAHSNTRRETHVKKHMHAHTHTQPSWYPETQSQSLFTVCGILTPSGVWWTAGQEGLLTDLGCTLVMRQKWIHLHQDKRQSHVQSSWIHWEQKGEDIFSGYPATKSCGVQTF